MKTVADKENQEAAKILEEYEISEELVDENGQIRILVSFDEVTTDQLKILSVISLPQSKTMTVVDKCKLAGVSRGTWYLAFKSSSFCDAVRDVSKRNIAMNYVPDSVHKLGLMAQDGDKEAAKILFQTAEITGDRRLGGHGPKGSSDGQRVTVIVNQDGAEIGTEDELIEKVIQRLEKRGYRVIRPDGNERISGICNAGQAVEQ